MKILVTSDWHLDAMSVGVERLTEGMGKLEDLACAIIDEKVDEFWFLGDMCDPSVRAIEIVTSVGEWMYENLNVPSLWLTGNHDVIEGERSASTLRPLHLVGREPDYSHSVVVDEPMTFRKNEFDVICLPFVNRATAYNPAKYLQMASERMKFGTDGKPLFILGHLTLAGIHPGSETEDMPRGRDVMFPIAEANKLFPDAMLMNGHYHTPQVYDGIHIPGSLERNTFGDKHWPGYMIVEF